MTAHAPSAAKSRSIRIRLSLHWPRLNPAPERTPIDQPQRQRLDKWLWHARVTRTRTLAQKLIESGTVRVNGQRVTASDHRVGPGDGLTIQIGQRLRVLRIANLADRRGSATIAAGLYEDISPRLEKPES